MGGRSRLISFTVAGVFFVSKEEKAEYNALQTSTVASYFCPASLNILGQLASGGSNPWSQIRSIASRLAVSY